MIPQGAVQGGAGAHLGSGVDVQAYRRIRDTFLDLQYRAQATRLGDEAARAEGLDRAELALAEPGDNGINKQLSEFWNAWSDLANAPDDPAARQSLVEQADALADAFGSRRRASSSSSASRRRPSTPRSPRPAARSSRSPRARSPR